VARARNLTGRYDRPYEPDASARSGRSSCQVAARAVRAECHAGPDHADAVTITLPDGTVVRAGDPGTDQVLSRFAGAPGDASPRA
jgi:hypothetical protein